MTRVRSVLGHCPTEFRQQSSRGVPRKGVERGLRQCVLSGVPLVPREVRARGKVQTSRGKETTFIHPFRNKDHDQRFTCHNHSKKKTAVGPPAFPRRAVLSSRRPNPRLLGTIELCVWHVWSCRSLAIFNENIHSPQALRGSSKHPLCHCAFLSTHPSHPTLI